MTGKKARGMTDREKELSGKGTNMEQAHKA